MVATPDVNYKVPTDFHFHSLPLSGLPLALVWVLCPRNHTRKSKKSPVNFNSPQGRLLLLAYSTRSRRKEKKTKGRERKTDKFNQKCIEMLCKEFHQAFPFLANITNRFQYLCNFIKNSNRNKFLSARNCFSIYTYIYFWAAAKTLPKVHCYAQILFGFVKNEHILLPVYPVVVIVPATERDTVGERGRETERVCVCGMAQM